MGVEEGDEIGVDLIWSRGRGPTQPTQPTQPEERSEVDILRNFYNTMLLSPRLFQLFVISILPLHSY